ncbi:unnamed protein product, partial [Brachionus calyciflorus]
TKTNDLLKYAGFILDREVEEVFDTAVSSSIIRFNTAKKLGLSIIPSDESINTEDGSTNKVIGVTEEIELKVSETVANLSFIITNVSHIEVLQGKNIKLDSEEESDFETEINGYLADQEPDDIFSHEIIDCDAKLELKQTNWKVLADFLKQNEFDFETTTETPVMSNPYRQANSVNDELKADVKKMLDAGIIGPGKAGTWASPAFLIKQKGGSRFVVDYNKLNSMTKPFLHPLPRIDDILDKLTKAEKSQQSYRKKKTRTRNCSENESPQKPLKIKKEEEVEMIAITYSIDNEKHPFYHLNGIPAGLELSKIIDGPLKEKLKKGDCVSFVHEIDNNHLIINGIISNEKTYKIPKVKVTKFLKETRNEIKPPSFESALFSISTQLTNLNNNLSKSSEENKEFRRYLVDVLSPRTSAPSSPTTSRKHQNKTQGDDDIQLIDSNQNTINNYVTTRDFTNSLRSQIKTEVKNNENQTLGWYLKNHL